MSDLIERQAAIDALWKALYEYEDKTEKQFQESEGLDLKDWFLHRIFVQNMSDIDRQTILNLPSAQPEKLYTKADYIMALHKEYGCSLTRAEEAHNKALEYLQEEMMMRGGKNERREREGLL